MPYLKVVSEDGRNISQNYPLTDETLIGRSKHADYPIYDDGVSNKHARIWKEDVLFHIMDLDSKNGTSLNNQPLTVATPLSVGDHIRIGQTVLMFVDDTSGSGVSMVVDKDDSKFGGTVFRKADELAKTVRQEVGSTEHLEFLTELGREVMLTHVSMKAVCRQDGSMMSRQTASDLF